MIDNALLQVVAQELERQQMDGRSLIIAWAHAAPTVVLVPAFGLRAVPMPARMIIALSLVAGMIPVAHVSLVEGACTSQVLSSAARGVPVAVCAALPLWSATMAGGLADSIHGTNHCVPSPYDGSRIGPLGLLFSLFACASFLTLGGPAKVAAALSQSFDTSCVGWTRVALDIASGIGIAVTIAAPILGASVLIELGFALMARSSLPTLIAGVLAPLRSFAVLAITALTFDRMAALISTLGRKGFVP